MAAPERKPHAYELRAITDADLPLLLEIYSSTRTEELAQVPWDDAQKAAFLRMQFEAQHHHYQTYYAGDRFDLILLDGEPIGRLYVGRWPSEICVIDISLLPAWRGRGIGGQLLEELILESEQSGRRVSVHVEKTNPARRLYERLGFIKVKDLEIYDQMMREPAQRASA
jgi:ribosomal protein S18 acetylase RimI-like enzyme